MSSSDRDSGVPAGVIDAESGDPMENVSTTPLEGLALCSACDRIWYSSGFIRADRVEDASCPDCGSALDALPEPFGEGTIYPPAEWSPAGPHA